MITDYGKSVVGLSQQRRPFSPGEEIVVSPPQMRPAPRSAAQVIDQAIAENKTGERLLYAFAIAFVVVGLSVLCWAIANRDQLFAAIGLLTSSLFWPAMTSVRRTRKESMAIRLLEAPLGRADTAKEAAAMLQNLFRETFCDQRQDGTPLRQKAAELAEK